MTVSGVFQDLDGMLLHCIIILHMVQLKLIAITFTSTFSICHNISYIFIILLFAVDTLRTLEDALPDFNGSAIVISHDRWFLNRICTHTLAFEGEGKVIFYPGTLTLKIGSNYCVTLICFLNFFAGVVVFIISLAKVIV